MKSEKGVFAFGLFVITVVIIFSCFLRNAEAQPRRGAVQGPRGGVAVEGPRGNVAVGTRYNVLPASARVVAVAGRTYYVDDSDVYYLPCEDDDMAFCVVAAPQ